MDVIKLLLECGAPVNARNESRSTPLHVAANPYNFYSPVSSLCMLHTCTVFLFFVGLNSLYPDILTEPNLDILSLS